MSAFVVDKTHIDALVTAGLEFNGRGSNLIWFDREPNEDDRRECFERGETWGAGAGAWYAAHRRELTSETAGTVGAMLWAENVRSVNHRYNEEEWEQVYEFSSLPGRPIDPRVVLCAIRCYTYQSCEHPEWPDSEARRFCEALTDACIRRLTAGVDVWEITDRNVFRTGASRRVKP